MDVVTVITVDLNRILQDILIEAIRQQANMEMLGSYRNIGELKQSGVTRCPDIVLIGRDISDDGDLIYRYAKAKIVCIESDGKNVNVWQLKPYRTALGEISPEKLADYLIHPGDEA